MLLGPLMVDIQGTELTQIEQDILAHPAIGGVILFARNYHDPQQLADLTRQIRCVKNPSILIAVDQEGGKVQRFQNQFTTIPSFELCGEQYKRDKATGLQLINNAATVMAYELIACGIDISFTPVLDLALPQSTVIGQLGRAFDADPEIVIQAAQHYITAMNKAGMQATGKHFPGHGTVAGDTHKAMLVDHRPLKDIEKNDLIPFKALLPQLGAVMMAHVIYDQVDELPASLSAQWIKHYLRQTLQFDGLVFSDALDMQALNEFGSMTDRVSMALAAGCDMALICNDPKSVEDVLDTIEVKANQQLANRIDFMRSSFDYDWQTLHELPEWHMMTKNIKEMSSYE